MQEAQTQEATDRWGR